MVIIALLCLGVILVWDDDYNGSEYEPDYIVFSSLDASILDTSDVVYQELRETLSPSDAREQLVERLNNDIDGVSEAVLGVDGYTIFIDFSDGDFAAVDTFEPVEAPDENGGTGYMIHEGVSPSEKGEEDTIHFGYFSSMDKVSSPAYSTVNFDYHDVSSTGKITCASKQVCILGPAYWELRYPLDMDLTKHIEETVQLFQDYGWDDDEITLKYGNDCPWEENSDCLLLTPDDFFDFGEYGIVLFIGHGAVRGYKSFQETNLYLQFCYMINESFKMNGQFRKWKEDKQLIIIDKYDQNPGGTVYSTAIRADVLRQKLTGSLDSSIFLFPVCYGGFLYNVYVDAGAEVFCGWNNKVDAETADECNKDILRHMLENIKCAYEAYADDSILKGYNYYSPSELSYEVPMWTGGDPGYKRTEFFIFPEPVGDDSSFSFYLPAWIDLTITDIPDGTASVKAYVYDAESTLLCQSEYEVMSATQIQIEDVGDDLFTPSGDVRVDIVAFDSGGGEIASSDTTITLVPGVNLESVSLSEEDIDYYWYLCADAEGTENVTFYDSVSGEEPSVFGFIIYVNEVHNFYVWYDFMKYPILANPGDELRLEYKVIQREEGVTWSFSPVWLHHRDSDYKLKLSDGESDTHSGPDQAALVNVYEETFIIPEIE